MALKETVPAFQCWNRCALIGRIYLSLVAYRRQVALPPTNRLRLLLFQAFCWRISGQAAGGPGIYTNLAREEGTYTQG